MAEELSELKFGKDYYDLDQKTQMDLYKQSSDYLDNVADDAADNLFDRMKEGRKGGGRVGMVAGGIMRLKKLLDEAYEMVSSRGDFDFSDYKMRGQLMAEELSELKFGKDYYDLDQKTQMDLYKQSSDYLDNVADDAADNLFDRMKEGRKGGGRVGMVAGGIMRLKKLLDEAYEMVSSRGDFDFSDYKMRGQLMAEELSELKFGKDYYDLDQKTQMDLYKQSSDYLDNVADDAADNARDIMKERFDKAEGGMPTGIMRTNAAGIKERDYRDEGGFVPVGIKEKADDVPAMLSKNEFVMTADAVRGAGDGSIEKGAQKMYDTMKKLEDKVA
jgi:hypothetical protein